MNRIPFFIHTNIKKSLLEVQSCNEIMDYNVKSKSPVNVSFVFFCVIYHHVMGLEYLLTEMWNYLCGKIRTTSQHANGFQQER